MEEDEQWKQLESSGKHVKHQYIFGEIIKKAEIACRTDQRKTRSDIVICSCDSREIGSEIIVFNGNKQQ